MTISDVSKLLAVIRVRYPTSKLWDEQPALLVQAWHTVLDDVPYPGAVEAFTVWSKHEKWAPDPAELREQTFDRLEACRTAEERMALDPEWRPQGSAQPIPLRAIS